MTEGLNSVTQRDAIIRSNSILQATTTLLQF